MKTIGLLGGMSWQSTELYYRLINEGICKRLGMEVLIPAQNDRDIVHNIIFDELCRGTIRDTSRREYLRIIEDLHQQGAVGIILGCTEICLLVSERDTTVPLYNTTEIHAEAAVQMALG